jgi:hypothetical protein
MLPGVALNLPSLELGFRLGRLLQTFNDRATFHDKTDVLQ